MIDCWRRSGTTSGAIHTAMPRTIVVLSWVYIITASSYEYKDGITTVLVACEARSFSRMSGSIAEMLA